MLRSAVGLLLKRLTLERGGSTPVLINHKKGICPLKIAFLGENQRPIRRLSNQISSFRLETHQLFFSYVQLTVMLHYRIHGFLHTELLVRNSFQSEAFRLRAAMKTQRLTNI